MENSSYWRKSTYSGGEAAQCVEMASVRNRVGIRDTKDLRSGHLTVEREALAALVGRIKAGDLDL
ncbi:DUF397 domain-containing protein [Actinomadura graeca]|uniref:DUF397 domain-containing protein n=1 Tax=Actinomadura graeca TaxID=2750812 RepID=A0ABX8QXF2_9ACTN|nr:DUF397 domain-containing protein [Actinomadura graeca]QXJ23298.1 DUF397 domain-containing protein [Actinomadura graeca]